MWNLQYFIRISSLSIFLLLILINNILTQLYDIIQKVIELPVHIILKISFHDCVIDTLK